MEGVNETRQTRALHTHRNQDLRQRYRLALELLPLGLFPVVGVVGKEQHRLSRVVVLGVPARACCVCACVRAVVEV